MKRVRKVDIDYVLRASQLFTKSFIKKDRTARVYANKKRSVHREGTTQSEIFLSVAAEFLSENVV